MSFNQTQFFESLEKLTNQVIKDNLIDTFIYDFLALLDISKATITSLRNNDSRTNVAIHPELGEVANKHRLYFKPISTDAKPETINPKHSEQQDTKLQDTDDLAKVLANIKSSPVIAKHKIRMIMVTDFETVLVYDTKFNDTLDCDFTDLYKNYHFLLPLAGLERAQEFTEHPADVQASEKMGRLFDHIRKYNEFDTPDDIHALNIFFTRLLFCFFAEDTGIFKPKQFHDTLESCTLTDGSDTDTFLYELFSVLDMPETKPSHQSSQSSQSSQSTQSDNPRANLPAHLSAFPYVNGSLFKYQFAIPYFNARTRRILLDCAQMNWAQINPDIFGSMFQAVIEPEQRGNLGQHYTSVSNIMKVIEPLFLQALRQELATLLALSDDNRHKNNKIERLDALLERISRIKVFDPACGSGNFLIIAYKELRELELEILKAKQALLKTGQGSMDNSVLTLDFGYDSVVSLDNFYGIDIDDFPSQIARLSLWLAEHQMNIKFREVFGVAPPTLPLKDSGHIINANSLRIDWQEVCPNNGDDEIYIVGNPPFGGTTNRDDEQAKDMNKVFGTSKTLKYLDYVTSWFWKGAQYIANSNARLALVSTNSIAQGEQVAMLFPNIFDLGVHISFAYQTFPWKNNAKHNAGVHVVIIGLSATPTMQKTIYKLVDKIWHRQVVENISPYLVSGSNTAVVATNTPLQPRTKMVFGNKPTDGGYLFLTLEEKNDLITKQPYVQQYIRPVLGAREFLHNEQRWCLWFANANLQELEKLPYIKERLDSVRQMRLASKAKSTREYSKYPHLFRQIAQPKSGEYIIVPRVSSERRQYVPIGFFECETIATDANQIIPNGTLYEFGILTSLAHNDWMRLVAGRLKSDYRYSGTIVYNTFPFPEASEQQKADIEALAEEILLTRADHVGKTLAELYDPDKMPADLKQAHASLDDAVDKLYRPQGFKNTEERLAHLLARYEDLIKAEEQQKLAKKAKKTKKVPK
ncbi:DNA methyltransferase [Psychrobacter sp. I-STPA6b]|uniref:DNA methyltransferase n=1 Tax=Psychrobacter sp. I-STPA6b TaxID=2585718 RepID=UPI001D0C6219|nr:DNA methyltransferase [Psychrobacter sp. I-STPA6b]